MSFAVTSWRDIRGTMLAVALMLVPVAATAADVPGKPATGPTGKLDKRLAEAGLARGVAVFIRIFKQESELELWMQRNGRFEHFATYPICYWDGGLGPKLAEGDRQAPEGFYSVGEDQLRWYGRWLRGLDLDYPNAFDRANGRTGSAIYIHGGCTSVGCFAMTNPVIEDVFELAVSALDGGQRRIGVHVFPFRMTAERMAAAGRSRWSAFWRDLKEGHDRFEASRVPPRMAVCEGRYVAHDGPEGYDGSERLAEGCKAPAKPREDRAFSWSKPAADSLQRAGRLMAQLAEIRRNPPRLALSYRSASAVAKTARSEIESRGFDVLCNPNLPSCRRWIMLKQKQIRSGRVVAGKTRKRKGQ